jgi:hypothetical protein
MHREPETRHAILGPEDCEEIFRKAVHHLLASPLPSMHAAKNPPADDEPTGFVFGTTLATLARPKSLVFGREAASNVAARRNCARRGPGIR